MECLRPNASSCFFACKMPKRPTIGDRSHFGQLGLQSSTFAVGKSSKAQYPLCASAQRYITPTHSQRSIQNKLTAMNLLKRRSAFVAENQSLIVLESRFWVFRPNLANNTNEKHWHNYREHSPLIFSRMMDNARLDLSSFRIGSDPFKKMKIQGEN